MAMLRVDVRSLRAGPVVTDGVLEPDDPALEGLGLRFVGPLEVDGELQAARDGEYVWQGHIRARVAGECRRCLADVTVELDDDVDVVFSTDPDLAEDPDVYLLAPDSDVVDVTMAVREEVALRLSLLPLCRPDCKGFCAQCGADLNAGPCRCAAAGTTR